MTTTTETKGTTPMNFPDPNAPPCPRCTRPAGACFPATFGLRAFPGEVFRVSERASYGSGGRPMLYTERRAADGSWSDWAKGREAELRAQLVLE